MNFLKENGVISFEKVGTFIANQPKDKWLSIKAQLAEYHSENSTSDILSSLEFFEKVGHINLSENKDQMMVYSERKKIKEEEMRTIMQDFRLLP